MSTITTTVKAKVLFIICLFNDRIRRIIRNEIIINKKKNFSLKNPTKAKRDCAKQRKRRI
jgi:hypothetical protein